MACVKETEYMYSSARIRAMENSLISGEGFAFLRDCGTFAEAAAKLSEYGINVTEDKSEDALEGLMYDACEFVAREVPHGEYLNFIKYPYDCNNLKACIKCAVRGISPEKMLYSCGVFTKENAIDAINGDFSGYPENMQKAISEAKEAYDKTKNPQLIDIILDKACFADMLECAKKSGNSLFVRLVRTKIDLTNIITCLRLLRIKMGNMGKSLLASGIIDGGTYGADFYCEMYEGGEAKLCEALAFSSYGKFILCVTENPDGMANIEKFADDMYMEIVRESKFIPFGIEVAGAYLVAVEYQIKNLRIILDAKRTGKSPSQIQNKLRYSYV